MTSRACEIHIDLGQANPADGPKSVGVHGVQTIQQCPGRRAALRSGARLPLNATDHESSNTVPFVTPRYPRGLATST